MNTVEQNILLLTQNNIALLGQMGPARNDMAVVEPVMVPEPPEPPDMVFQIFFVIQNFIFICL
jgi:hypothetical protein